jgi:hypothetical protein
VIPFAHEQLADVGHPGPDPGPDPAPAPAPDADADAKDCQARQPAIVEFANGAVATHVGVAPAQVLEVGDGMPTNGPRCELREQRSDIRAVVRSTVRGLGLPGRLEVPGSCLWLTGAGPGLEAIGEFAEAASTVLSRS